MSKKVHIEVIGVTPPCKRCKATWKNVESAASGARSAGIEVTMEKLDIASDKTLSKYGPIMSPALALNGTVRTMGRIPETKEIEALIKEAAG
ncbi:MAG: thioredoxin family protein [Candidatus Bathyarchaeia archaeon]